MLQEYKTPEGEKFLVRYDEVSLILQQNKMLRVLSPEDIRFMLESFGGNPPLDSSKQLTDDELMSIVSSRRLQEPSILKAHCEAAFRAYQEGKQKYEDALKSFKDGSYMKKEEDPKIE